MKFKIWLGLQEEFGPFIGKCLNRDDYQISGACSDQNSDKKNERFRKGLETIRRASAAKKS